MGLTPRFSSSSAENGQNILTGGGSAGQTDTQSIWLVVWGPNTVHGIYPKGSQAGLQHRDLGEVTLMDSASPAGRYQGYRTHYKWDIGLTVRDWRYIVRVRNIDLSDLVIGAGSGANLVDLMVQAAEIPPNLSLGRAVFYCSRTIRAWLRRQILAKSNVNLTFDTVAGKRVLAFDGIPVKRCDSLVNETAV